MKKKIMANYIYSSFYQIILIIVPFITAPYLARTLLPEAIGINSYVSAVVQVFSLLGLLGLNNYSIREVAYARDNKNKLTKVFSELISLRFILLFITSIIYFIYAMLSEYKIYFLIQYIAVFSTFFDVSWLYIGLEEFKVTVTRSFIVKIINVTSIFLFIKSPDDLGLFMVISTAYTVIGNFILYFGVKKRVGKLVFKNLNIKKHIKPVLKLFLPYAASLVYLQMDKLMIKVLAPNVSVVGFYDQAERIVKIPLALITALSNVMLPRISNEFIKKNNEQIKKYINTSIAFSLLLSIPLMFGVFSISSTMIPWFLGDNYLDVIPIMMMLSPIVVFISLSSVTGTQYLTSVNDTKTLTKSYIFGAIVNLILNFIFIPIFSGVGAAIGTVAAEATVFFVQFIFIKDVLNKKDNFKLAAKYLMCGLFMTIVCSIIGVKMKPTIVTTLVQIVLGVISYFGIILIIRDEFAFNLFKTFLNKIKQIIGRKSEKNGEK